MKKQALGVLLTSSLFTSSLFVSLAHAQRLAPPSDIPGHTPNVVQNIQSQSNFRVIELEEKVRNLNGKVEELNFLLLQLQEKLRKMEENNEIRFQEIEDKLSDASGSNSSDSKVATNTDGGDNRLGKPEPSGATKAPDAAPATNTETSSSTTNQNSGSTNRGEPPRALGTLVFDKDGNVIDGATGSQPASPVIPFGTGTEGAVEASEFGSTPSEVFKVGKASYDQRQYGKAEQVFRAHIKAWPKAKSAGAARHYLGQSLFWQKRYYDAAEMHLDTHNTFPQAPTAADNLLGLGLALAGLNQREVACATYAEVLKQYPDAKRRLGDRVKDEQAAARC